MTTDPHKQSAREVVWALLEHNPHGYPLKELYGDTYVQAMEMVSEGEVVYQESTDLLYLPLFG